MATRTELADAFKRLDAALQPLDDQPDTMARADEYRDRAVAFTDGLIRHLHGRKPAKCQLHQLVPPCTGCAGDRLASTEPGPVNPRNAYANGIRPVVQQAQAHTRSTP